MKNSSKMKNLMKKCDLIGKKSLPLCKHENKEVSQALADINNLAHEMYKELDRLRHDFRYKEQAPVDETEPIVKFL